MYVMYEVQRMANIYQIRTLVAMATYSLHRLIMGKVEIGNLYCLIGDNRILFLQKCLLNIDLNPATYI